MARHLPEDLVTGEIMPRLPAKSIGRFRSVSKPWKSLLSSSEFVKSHLQIHRNDPEEILLRANYGINGINSIGFSREGGGGSVANLMAIHPYTGLTIFQLGPSCNGLVLALLGSLGDPVWTSNASVILMNPVIKEYIDVSNPNHFDVWRFGLGFGYDEKNDDYKIVALISSENVEVYSVRRKSWRSTSRFPFSIDMYFCRRCVNGVFANGYVYWKGGRYYHDGKELIGLAAFNLATEEFEKVPLPSALGLKSTREWFKTCLLDGFLALVFRECNHFDIWVMKEHGVEDSWTNVAKIEYPGGHVDGQMVGKRLRVVGNLNRDETVMFCDDKKFFSYNMKSQIWRFVDIPDLGRIPHGPPVLTPFRGSLVSLNPREEE